MASKPVTVSELTRRLKEAIEGGFPAVLVEGEACNVTDHPASGHIYFILKDDKSSIKCTLWRWKRGILKFRLEDGQKVVVGGPVRVYEKGGQYQLSVEAIEPFGIGAQQLALEQLKAALAKEGLFDESRKRPLPPFPERIGVVTSESGAAFHDICKVARRRMPGMQIILNPAQVQGDGAARDIARAIREFNEYGLVDLLIVGRGGGSSEDLSSFNEEAVVRAIAGSSIPVISAVGHEVDTTLADYAADLRAATPSAAAELAVPDRDDLVLRVKAQSDALAYNLKMTLESNIERFQRLSGSFVFRRPEAMVEAFVQRLDDLMRLFDAAALRKIDTVKNRMKNASEKLVLLNPLAILARGYSATFREGKVITDAAQAAAGDVIETLLSKGRLKSRVL